MNMNEKQFGELMKKLDLLIKLNGINVISHFETDKEKIILLTELDLSAGEIIKITGIRAQYVYDIRSQHMKDESQ